MFPWVAEQFCAASFRKLPVKPHGDGLSGRQVIYDIDTCCPLAADTWSSSFVHTYYNQTVSRVVFMIFKLFERLKVWQIIGERQVIYDIDTCCPLVAECWTQRYYTRIVVSLAEPIFCTSRHLQTVSRVVLLFLFLLKDWKFGKCWVNHYIYCKNLLHQQLLLPGGEILKLN